MSTELRPPKRLDEDAGFMLPYWDMPGDEVVFAYGVLNIFMPDANELSDFSSVCRRDNLDGGLIVAAERQTSWIVYLDLYFQILCDYCGL